MRKVDNGEKKRKKEKNGVFSGHYVIASSLERRTLVPISFFPSVLLSVQVN